MRRTDEQQAFLAKLRALVDEAGLGRVRVVADAEGFPIVPGRLGQVDWRGAEWATGEERLYVYTARPRIVGKLLVVPGVHRWQMGDTEACLWFPAHDHGCLRAVLTVIRARMRRPASPGNPEALRRARLRRVEVAGSV